MSRRRRTPDAAPAAAAAPSPAAPRRPRATARAPHLPRLAGDTVTIASLRAAIDALDDRLLELLNERAAHARRIAELRAASAERAPGAADPEAAASTPAAPATPAAPNYAADREAQLVARLTARNPGPLPAPAIEAIFGEVMSACRSLARRLRVAFMGPEASWSHAAAERQFGSQVDAVIVPSIPAVFEEVRRGQADFGVVPVENTTEGSVGITLDLLRDTPLHIAAERTLPIHHNLLARPGTRLADVRRVASHPQALAQCRLWLERRLPDAARDEAPSTAAAAALAARTPGVAAVASALAARRLGLEILEQHIEDQAGNRTRFFVLSGRPPPRVTAGPRGAPPREKTSLVFAAPHAPGALHRALGVFASKGVNLTRLESRPARDLRWEYVFFADLDGHRDDAAVAAALRALARRCAAVKVIGSYPAIADE